MPQALYVANIPFNLTEEQFRQLAERFGPVSSAKIIFERRRGETVSRGFGFVTFEGEEATQAFLSSTDIDVDGRKLIVREARPPRPKTTAFVAGIAPELDEEGLKAHFAQFNPESAKIVRKGDETTKGFGFVNFNAHEDLVAACRGMNGSEFLGKRLVVVFARSRGGRAPQRRNRTQHTRRAPRAPRAQEPRPN